MSWGGKPTGYGQYYQQKGQQWGGAWGKGGGHQQYAFARVPQTPALGGGQAQIQHRPVAAGPYSQESWQLRDILLRMKHRRWFSPHIISAKRNRGPAAAIIPMHRTERVTFDCDAAHTTDVGAGLSGSADLAVRVLLLRVEGEPGSHLAQRIRLLLQRDIKNPQDMRFYGGQWDPVDGDIASPDTPERTARRCLKGAGIELGGVPLRPFCEARYDRGGKDGRVIFLHAEITGLRTIVAPGKVVSESREADGTVAQEALAVPGEYTLEQMRSVTLMSEEGFEVMLGVDMLWETCEETMAQRIVQGLRNARKQREEAGALQKERESSLAEFNQARRQALTEATKQWEAQGPEAVTAGRAAFEQEWDAKAVQLQEQLATKQPEVQFDQTLASAFAFFDDAHFIQTRWMTEEKLRIALQATCCETTPQSEDELVGPVTTHRNRGLVNYQHIAMVPQPMCMPQEQDFIRMAEQRAAAGEHVEHQLDQGQEPAAEGSAEPGLEHGQPSQEGDQPESSVTPLPATPPAASPAPESSPAPEASAAVAAAAVAGAAASPVVSQPEVAQPAPAEGTTSGEKRSAEPPADPSPLKKARSRSPVRSQPRPPSPVRTDPTRAAAASPPPAESPAPTRLAPSETPLPASRAPSTSSVVVPDGRLLTAVPYKELQAMCKERNLKASGKTEDLRSRLAGALSAAE